MSPRGPFTDAARWFVEVSALAAGREDEPGLGVWTVRDLVGHASRSLLTVEAYLEPPPGPAAGTTSAPDVDLAGPVEYYRAIRGTLADQDAFAERGRAAGAALGDDLATAVEVIATRVLGLLEGVDDSAAVATPWGRMTLRGYLPTRTVELTVHTCDLVAALGHPARVPRTSSAETLAVLGGLAAADGRASDLLLAATGRRGLPGGYTVL